MDNITEIESIQKGFAENPVLVEQYKKTKAAFQKAETYLKFEVGGIGHWHNTVFEKQLALLDTKTVTLDELKKLSCSGKQLPEQGVKYHLSEELKQKTIENYPDEWRAFLVVANKVEGIGVNMSIQQFVIVDV